MILQAVRQAIQEHHLLSAGQGLLVAVSGGLDSMALLHILLQLQAEWGLRLHVASLNHGIRGKAAQDDLRFVQRTAAAWGLDCTVAEADVPQMARERGIGIEEAARVARYDFLARVAQQTDMPCVATAHHALDQAETILMHILYGSGLRGLRGMQFAAALPGHPDRRLIRPLLGISRAALDAYCTENGLRFCEDKSNADTRHQRSFIRHQVMPRLLDLNPAALAAFARLAEAAALDENYIAAQFAAAVMPRVAVSERGWRISKADCASLHPALQRRLLRAAFRELGARTLSHEKTRRSAQWAANAPAGGIFDLGSGLRLRADDRHLYIETEAAQTPAADYPQYRLIDADADIALRLEAGAHRTASGICIRLAPDAPGSGSRLCLPAGTALELRTRRPGDRFKPKGMGGKSRKIKNWMIDRKIPRAVRGQIPLLCADGEIIAICVGTVWHLAELPAPKGAAALCLQLD